MKRDVVTLEVTFPNSIYIPQISESYNYWTRDIFKKRMEFVL